MRPKVPERFLGKVHFVPQVPDRISGLNEMARNLWWTWNPQARRLFRMIDLATWITTKGNAVRFLRNVSQAKLDEAAGKKEFLDFYEKVHSAFTEYMTSKSTWWHKNCGDLCENTLFAYFSAEYGLHETLQIYSGGLGVLAGDHQKSASDLGLPLVAVGLLYRDGYFQQWIDAEGNQKAEYQRQRWEELPIEELKDEKGDEIKIRIDFPGRIVVAKVWAIHVGRVRIFMLDTDLPENSEHDRSLTSRLYGGDTEMRIQQEILLGIGGIKALRKLRQTGHLKQDPTVYHMNEGHAAFLSLERLREFMQEEGLNLQQATEVIRASSVFTTHTPVPAGHDRFALPLVEKYFRSYYEGILISRTQFFDFGLEPMPDGQQLFSMTFLALHFSGQANGVSELHGEVSRRMMAPIWTDVPPSEIPIGHVTNGVHARTWMSFDMQELFDEYIGPQWRDRIMDPEMWAEAVEKIPDEVLWKTKGEMKKALVRFIHDRLKVQHTRFGDLPDEMRRLDDVFSDEVMTIGFARRFATYKRATLIFTNIDRLRALVTDTNRPIQLVFAGKAHPADKPGQDFIRQIIHYARVPEFRNRLVFLENYDMNIGRRLTAGVDLWLNNPRRPYEASGTSGMKVPLNGGLNCSILDGWWPEAYHRNPLTGWAIGFEKDYISEEHQDKEDAEHLYLTLEREVIPTYYERDENGIPHGWLRRVKEAMKTCGPLFNTDRMVTDYVKHFYVRSAHRTLELVQEKYREARQYAERKHELRRNWGHVRVNAEAKSAPDAGTDMISAGVKEQIAVTAEVYLGAITPAEVRVEIYAEDLTANNGALPRITTIPMEHAEEKVVSGQVVHIYTGALKMNESGEHGFTVRVVPHDEDLFHPMETGLVRWAYGPVEV